MKMTDLKNVSDEELKAELDSRMKKDDRKIRWWEIVLSLFVIFGIPVIAGIVSYFTLFREVSSDIRVLGSFLGFAGTLIFIGIIAKGMD